MNKRAKTTTNIIQTTVAILCEEGAGGLTMRKVAKQAGIRLSNLQYYYKDKNALLEATIGDYFHTNEQELIQQMRDFPDDIAFASLLEVILHQFLIHGSTSERCAMFREIWALATKIPAVDLLVKNYYQQHNHWLIQQFSPYLNQPELAVSILMPYIEGYSLMGYALPVDKTVLVQQLIKMILPYCKD